MGLLSEQDLIQISQTLYESKASELYARTILKVNTNYSPFAETIGYTWYNRKGAAKLLASGASAKDVPFVSEDGGRHQMRVFDATAGIRYSRKELEASKMVSTQTNVPSVKIDMIRPMIARRAIAEIENQLVFNGDPDYKIFGILNHPNINVEDVAQGAVGANPVAKRLWTNKTAKEKLKDLLTAKSKSRNKGLFQPDTLCLPPDQFDMLDEPFADNTETTLRTWLTSKGMNFPKIYSVRELEAANNSYGVDCILMLDSNPEHIEIAVTKELGMTEPVVDIVGNEELVAYQSLAGAVIRQPTMIYVGRGI